MSADPQAKMQKLAALAVDQSTTDGERAAAALQLAKLFVRHGFNAGGEVEYLQSQLLRADLFGLETSGQLRQLQEKFDALTKENERLKTLKPKPAKRRAARLVDGMEACHACTLSQKSGARFIAFPDFALCAECIKIAHEIATEARPVKAAS